MQSASHIDAKIPKNPPDGGLEVPPILGGGFLGAGLGGWPGALIGALVGYLASGGMKSKRPTDDV